MVVFPKITIHQISLEDQFSTLKFLRKQEIFFKRLNHLLVNLMKFVSNIIGICFKKTNFELPFLGIYHFSYSKDFF